MFLVAKPDAVCRHRRSFRVLSESLSLLTHASRRRTLL